MPLVFHTSTFWQTIVVWLLFLSSISTLFFNSVSYSRLRGQELAIRETARTAGVQLAAAAVPVAARSSSNNTAGDLNAELELITRDILSRYEGAEGGFYLSDARDEFLGYAFPSEHHPGPRRDVRRDPPPKEEPYIRLQAKQTAGQENSDPLIQSRDVGPSRVVVATTPVGTDRPARLVSWLMYRVTGPEQHRDQLNRYQVSTSLALGGIVVSLLLTLSLRRTLQTERSSRERLRDELRRSEHLASLGLMVAQVAHELRNPLAGIRSTVQLWQRLPADSRTPESLQAVISAVDRLDALLTNLLQFSRSEMADRADVDLNAVVRETGQLLAVQLREQHVQLTLVLDPQLPPFRGSASGLRQVVLNLATNALQAMPGGGNLSCQTRSNPAGTEVELEITDTGQGIDPTTRARLFEPFFTTRAAGTGLGLALCREIVMQHHGQIELLPVEPHGTRCRVQLPVQTTL